jgi:prepilin-type N-terminal cleavage/methylation domain-containing protein
MMRQNGFTLVEIVMAMGIGGIFVVGTLGLLANINKSVKQVSSASDFNYIENIVFQQLSTGGGCGAFFPSSLNPTINVAAVGAKTQLTLLADTTSTPPNIRIQSDGSTVIGGFQYLAVLTVTDISCTSTINPCYGTISIVLNRVNPSPAPSVVQNSTSFGLRTQSQDIQHVSFTLGSGNSLAGCGVQGYSMPGAVSYDNSACIFPPATAATGGPTWGGNNVPVVCPTGYIAVGACGAGIKQVSPPAEVPPRYNSAYCTGSSGGQVGVDTSLACCRLVDPTQILGATPTWRPTQCLAGTGESEVVTGICSREPNPNGQGGADLPGNQYPVAPCTSGNVQCTPIKKINMISLFCHTDAVVNGNTNHCRMGEIMTGFCGQGSNCPDYNNITCCTVFP